MEDDDEKIIKAMKKESNRSLNYLLKNKDHIKSNGGKFTYKKRFFLAYRFEKLVKRIKHWMNTTFFSIFK